MAEIKLQANKRTKYDWATLKTRYYESEIMDILAWIRIEFGERGVKSGNIKRKTQAWQEEKRHHLQIIHEDTLAKMKELKSDEEATKQHKLMLAGKQLILNTVIGRVSKEQANLSMSELKTALDIIKRELGEPLNIDQIQGNPNAPISQVVQFQLPANNREPNQTIVDVTSQEKPTSNN